jgi:hypothetical protein
MGPDRIEPISWALPVHLRHMEMRVKPVEEDMWEILRRFEALYPTAVYFRKAYKDRAAIFCRSVEEYVAALPITNFAKVKQKFFIMRVPWPEEIAAGDEQSLMGKEFPYAAELKSRQNILYDPMAWYGFGRVVTIGWSTNFPIFLPAQKASNQWAYNRKPYPIIGEYLITESHRTNDFDTLIQHSYNKDQIGAHEFMLSIKNLVKGIFTRRELGVYDPIDGEYLGAYRNVDQKRFSIRLLKRAALMDNAYVDECGLYQTVGYSKEETPDLPAIYKQRYVAVGASPELKAEAFLEVGRALEGISGLDLVARDKISRRFERKQKQRKTEARNMRQI